MKATLALVTAIRNYILSRARGLRTVPHVHQPFFLSCEQLETRITPVSFRWNQWVTSTNNRWSNTSNWDYLDMSNPKVPEWLPANLILRTPGELGHSEDRVWFSGNSNTDCSVDESVQISMLVIEGTYTKTLDLGSNTITMVGNATSKTNPLYLSFKAAARIRGGKIALAEHSAMK